MSQTKPWTEKKQLASVLNNEGLRIGERSIPGGALRGVYAEKAFRTGEPVSSFHGWTLTMATLFGLHDTDKPLFDLVNEYAVGTPNGELLCPAEIDSLGAHLINHSCGPNVHLAEMERGTMIMRATRPISPGDEVTFHYGWLGIRAVMSERWHPCACTAPFCTGNIELKLEASKDEDGAGIRLPRAESEKRLLADIANDTDANENALYGFLQSGGSMMPPGAMKTRPDEAAFFEGLCAAASAAVRASETLPRPPSERRLRQIRKRYHLHLFGESTRPDHG